MPLYRKSLQEKVDDDILPYQYFPRPTWKREKKWKLGLITKVSNSTIAFSGRR
jgi:hypothetical protein